MTTREAFQLIKMYFNRRHLGICSLGRTAEECFANLPTNQILFLDCLGSVVDTAVGVSVGCPDVWIDAFETDGSFLSNQASIYTLASLQTELTYLTLFIFDNALLESGGGKASRTLELNWEQMFAAWNITTRTIGSLEELNRFLLLRPTISKIQIVVLHVNNKDVPICTKDIDGRESKYLFKRYIQENFKKGIIKPCKKN